MRTTLHTHTYLPSIPVGNTTSLELFTINYLRQYSCAIFIFSAFVHVFMHQNVLLHLFLEVYAKCIYLKYLFWVLEIEELTNLSKLLKVVCKLNNLLNSYFFLSKIYSIVNYCKEIHDLLS